MRAAPVDIPTVKKKAHDPRGGRSYRDSPRSPTKKEELRRASSSPKRRAETPVADPTVRKATRPVKSSEHAAKPPQPPLGRISPEERQARVAERESDREEELRRRTEARAARHEARDAGEAPQKQPGILNKQQQKILSALKAKPKAANPKGKNIARETEQAKELKREAKEREARQNQKLDKAIQKKKKEEEKREALIKEIFDLAVGDLPLPKPPKQNASSSKRPSGEEPPAPAAKKKKTKRSDKPAVPPVEEKVPEAVDQEPDARALIPYTAEQTARAAQDIEDELLASDPDFPVVEELEVDEATALKIDEIDL